MTPSPPEAERRQLTVGGGGGYQVGFDARVVAPGIEVVEAPLGQGVELDGSVHGRDMDLSLSRDNALTR